MEPYLFEISSEAGRQVGGIYTVIKSKSRYASQYFKDRYMFIGFYDESCSHDVKFTQPPKNIVNIFEDLAHLGIYCHYGHWTYANNTPIILVDAKQFGTRHIQYDDSGHMKNDVEVNYIKFLLWKNFQIDSLMERSYDFSENVVWGWAVGMLLEKLCQIAPYKDAPKISHFHEWIGAAGLLYARLKSLPLATVFTTHATVLGRSLAASGVDVLQKASESPQQVDLSRAYELKVEGKHQLETMAAKKCHVFTTVSETVAQEVRYILGKYPDTILLNGLDFENEMREGQVRDISAYVRHEILQLCESVLAPYGDGRYDNALLLFTSGRYEYTNKGFDIYIKALAKLNQKLKEEQKGHKQIIAFVFSPSSVRAPKLSIIRNYLLIDKMNELLDATPSNNSHKHYHNTKERIDDVKTSIKNDLGTMYSGLIKEGSHPTISLYDLNYANDEIINVCLANGLDNSLANPVKIFFYPTYVKPNDGLLNMSYDDVISGMDMGIFPSRYEPFGYTPLEAGLRLNISVSTDSAGFGRFLQSKEDLQNRGVKILSMGGGADNAANELADYIHQIYMLTPAELEQKRHDSFALMHSFDWKELISNYLKAYDLALERTSKKEETHALVPQESHPLTAISKKVALVAQAKQKIFEAKKMIASKKSPPPQIATAPSSISKDTIPVQTPNKKSKTSSNSKNQKPKSKISKVSKSKIKSKSKNQKPSKPKTQTKTKSKSKNQKPSKPKTQTKTKSKSKNQKPTKNSKPKTSKSKKQSTPKTKSKKKSSSKKTHAKKKSDAIKKLKLLQKSIRKKK